MPVRLLSICTIWEISNGSCKHQIAKPPVSCRRSQTSRSSKKDAEIGFQTQLIKGQPHVSLARYILKNKMLRLINLWTFSTIGAKESKERFILKFKRNYLTIINTVMRSCLNMRTYRQVGNQGLGQCRASRLIIGISSLIWTQSIVRVRLVVPCKGNLNITRSRDMMGRRNTAASATTFSHSHAKAMVLTHLEWPRMRHWMR